MIRNIFLDRDGIINEVVMRDSVISSPRTLEEFRIRDDFSQFYRAIKDGAANLFVISNQPDVSRKLLSEDALEQMNEVMRSRFSFTEIAYCKHDDADQCECRKPKPGMISSLMLRHGLQSDESIIIGDSYKDILAGQAAGIGTIYCRQGYNSTISCEPDYIVNTLTEALSLPIFQALS